MTKHKKTRRPLVLVEWKDHVAHSGWKDMEKAGDVKLAGVMSVGWIIHEDQEKIVLAGSHDDEWDEVGDRQTIGKGLVVSMKVLRK